MFTFTKKNLINSAMTVALAFSVGQCAWAGLDLANNKLALSADGISVVGNDSGESRYLEDGEEYVIDANSPEAVSVPYTTRLTGNIQVVGNKDKISVSLRDADVKQVLRMFADKAKMNIIFHNSVSGTVTIDLKDVPADTALEFILDAAELTYVRQDNNLIIATKDAAKDLSYARQNFTVIPVKYANAQSIANFLNKSMFTGKYQGVSSVPVVAVNASKNELMVFGTEEDERLIYKLLERLDTKPMMNVFPVNHVSPAEMAATICDTILSDKSEGGANNGVSLNQDSRSSGSDDEIELGGGYTVCVIGENNGSIEKADDDGLTGYTSNPLVVAYFPGMGTIALYGGSREQVKMVESFIKLHDKKQPMAYIELSLIQLSESGSKIFNTEWKAWTPFGTFNFTTDSDGNAIFGQDPNGPTFLKGSKYDILDDTTGEVTRTISKYHGWGPIVMSLNYLITNGKARVLASPKIMVTNGKKSTIDLTSDYLKSVKQEVATVGITGIPTTTYEIGSDQGIKVEITPFISPDGYVVMKLNPQYSTIKTSLPQYTLLSRRNIELENVRVKDGETLVLAGMIQEQEQNNVQKIPVLGDLPVVGPFFRRTNSSTEKEETVILITPHIVYSKDQIESIKTNNTDSL